MSMNKDDYMSMIALCLIGWLVGVISGSISGYQMGKQEGARKALEGKAHIVPLKDQPIDTVIFDE